MIWYKVYTRWSDGHTLETYLLYKVPMTKDQEGDLDDHYRELNDWSGHYRGVSIEQVEHPPLSWVDNAIDDVVSSLKSKREFLTTLFSTRFKITGLP